MAPQRRSSIALAVVLSVAAVSAHADVTGPARVIDGDTIVINGEHVRLQGVDAPETHQVCTAYGREWPCGRTAAEWLKEHLNGRHVRRPSARSVRPAAGGMLHRRENVNDRLVREGWALDYRRYSTDYLSAEAEAIRTSAGIWRGEFLAPWDWRRER
jgi:endonuclease YncB( thermonuclease family)